MRIINKVIAFCVVALHVLFLACLDTAQEERYSVIIDSGSTGSRVYIYQYSVEAPIRTMHEVAQMRITPGLSTFADDLVGAQHHIGTLLNYTKEVVDQSLWSTTPVSLKATAGVRALHGREQLKLTNVARSMLTSSGFLFDSHETRVLSGGEEALYAFLAVNAAFSGEGNISRSNNESQFEYGLGAADLGGSSTQISFLLSSAVSTDELPRSPTLPVMTPSEDAGVDAQLQSQIEASSTATGWNLSYYDVDPFAWLSSNLDALGLRAFTLSGAFLKGFNSSSVEEPCRPDYHIDLPGFGSRVGVVARSISGLGLVSAMDALLPSPEDLSAAAATAEEVRRSFGAISLNPKFSNLLIETAFNQVGSASEESQCEVDSGDGVVNELMQQWAYAENESLKSDGSKAELGLGAKLKQNFDRKLNEIVKFLTTAFLEADAAAAAVLEDGTSESIDHHLQEADIQDWEYQYNPCLAPGIPFPYLRDGAEEEVFLHGSGNFNQCVQLIKHLLREVAKDEIACMKTKRPLTIVGMDNFPKVLEVLRLSAEEYVSPAQIREAGSRICRRSWLDIQAEFPDFLPYRTQRACFGASYVYAFMTEVYRIADNDRTSFLPVETAGQYTLGWPLGAAVAGALKLGIKEHDSSLLDVFFMRS